MDKKEKNKHSVQKILEVSRSTICHIPDLRCMGCMLRYKGTENSFFFSQVCRQRSLSMGSTIERRLLPVETFVTPMMMAREVIS